MNYILGAIVASTVTYFLLRLAKRNAERSGQSTYRIKVSHFIFLWFVIVAVIGELLSPYLYPIAARRTATSINSYNNPEFYATRTLSYEKNTEWYASETAAAEQYFHQPTESSDDQINVSGCTLWSSVTLSDVGKTLCVYGVVKHSTIRDGTLFLTFSNKNTDFFFVHYGGTWFEGVENNCAMAEGKIQQIGGSPVIVINQYDLHFCE